MHVSMRYLLVFGLVSGAAAGTAAAAPVPVSTNIHDLGATSERLFELRPVEFQYKEHVAAGQTAVQFGLIAEEVAEVFPELVVHGEDGLPQTVLYQHLPVLLLAEVQRLQRRVEELEAAARP